MSIDGVVKTNKKRIVSIDGIRPVPLKKPDSINNTNKKEPITPKRTTHTSKENVVKITTFSETTPVSSAEDKFLSPIESFDFNISSDEISNKPEKKAPEPKKKKKHVFRRVLIVLFVLFAITLAVTMIWGNEIISKITGGQSNILDAFTFITDTYTELKTDENGRTNVLIFGTSGYDMEGTEGDYAHDGAQLTDTIMVVSLDQKTGDVAMVNLPRDLKAGRTCTATGKINEVYWCNNMYGDDESSGVIALEEKISEILGIDIQYYAHVNWETLVSVVDAVGGITVTLDEDINDAWYTGTVISAGVPTTLNGEQALGLARARHGTELGDFSRGNSQQKILIALKEKVLEEGIGLTEAINILNSLGDNVRTDISIDEIKTGVHLLKDFDLAKMRQIPLLDWNNNISYFTTGMINDISYVLPSAGDGNYFAIQKYLAQKLDNNPIVREGSNIEILNGSDISGLAAAEQEKLKSGGFLISSVGDAPEGEYDELEIYILNEDMIETKNELSKFYDNTVIRLAEDLPDGIVSNADFLIILGGSDLDNEE